MNGRRKLVLAAAVAVAVAVPAVVIARGNLTTAPADNFAANSVSDVSTNSTHYEPIGLPLPDTLGAVGVTVSAQMTKGKARFRLAQQFGGDPAGLPSSVLFSSKAANAFSFASPNACPPLEVEWKRVGDAPAKAAEVSYLAVYDLVACT